MTLWKKDYTTKNEIADFTVGNDYIIDKHILKFDCIASIAHAKMLCKMEVLSEKELASLIFYLEEIISLDAQDKFEISKLDEDCHTAIEKYLTKKCGDAGKKIHTCRSRNDQVLTAIRLYEKDSLDFLSSLLQDYKAAIETIIEKFGDIPFPGYTHMQKAMPTSVKTWAECYLHSNIDNLKLLEHTKQLIDQSPLGTAAGYGVPVFEIDRQMTSEIMGFSKVLENPIYAQLSRGKFESTIIHTLSQIMFDANKIATDLITFSMDEFGLIKLPVEFCTGSSIMPQKKNPDVLELIRAKYHIILGEEIKVKSIISNLIFGYNRDLQLVKEPLITCFQTTFSSISILSMVLKEIIFDETKCNGAMSAELYATQEAYEMVKSGTPFRDAYKKVGEKFGSKDKV